MFWRGRMGRHPSNHLTPQLLNEHFFFGLSEAAAITTRKAIGLELNKN
jgi:hypothetical protein